MSVTILAPLDGDTVPSPVAVFTAFSFAAGSFTLGVQVGATAAPPPPPSVSGNGVLPSSVPVPTSGNFTVTVNAGPTTGGSDSQANVTVNSIGIVQILNIAPALVPAGPITPGPTAPAAQAAAAPKKKFDVKGKSKTSGTTVPAKVTCKAFQVDVATKTRTEVDSKDDTPSGGNWKVRLEFGKDPNFQYIVRAFAFDAGGNLLGSFTQHVP